MLLVLSVSINYIDRGNLSVAGVAVSSELHLNSKQLGVLFSAFFLSYAAFMIFAGWLVERYNVAWVYGAGYLIWSTATILTGLSHGFAALFALRLLLGASESVAYPSYSKIIAAGFSERERGVANGLIDAGSKLGPAIGLIIGGAILNRFGWRAVFLIIGSASLLWLIPWSVAARAFKTARPPVDERGPGFVDILRQRDAWATFLALFCANYAWYFLLTWLPGYLQMERHYSTGRMASIGSLPFFSVAAGALTGGWLSDAWIARGGSVTRVRKTFVVTGLSLSATLLLPSAIANNATFAMALLIAATFCFGLFSSNLWAITQTLAGPAAAGRWTGLQNCAGNLAGVAAPSITGFVVHHTHSFYVAFVLVCANLLMSALSYLVFVGRVEPVTWTANMKESSKL
jgi:ACS family D-galactonate transporter-like MFS transporter